MKNKETIENISTENLIPFRNLFKKSVFSNGTGIAPAEKEKRKTINCKRNGFH